MKTELPFPAGSAPQSFVSKFGDQISAILHGFDRVRLRGTVRELYCPQVMEAYLSKQHILLKEFEQLVSRTTGALKAATLAFAQKWSRPVEYVASSQRSKEELAREIAQRDGINEGLIAVLSAVEPCHSYQLRGNRETHQLELKLEERKCLHFYFYFEHPLFGFMHLRLQSWFPFRVDVCVNGRHWLARQLDKAGVAYTKRENAILSVADPLKAQAFLDEQVQFHWADELDSLLRETHPTSASICAPLGLRYYWSISESEYASDVLFRRPEDLARIYPSLVHHGIRSFGSSDVMRFLGRKVPTSTGRAPGHFQGEIISDLKHRPEGIRIKHSLHGNSIKLYDKQGSVLRVETTIVHPEEFKVYRAPENNPTAEKSWRTLRRSVADTPRRAEISKAANQRYLQALASTTGSVPLYEQARSVCQPVRDKGRRYRALNPLSEEDARVLQAISRGEFTVSGFRNRDLRELLCSSRPSNLKIRKQAAAKITRILRLLRAHRLIRKLGNTHRYVLTEKGRTTITALLAARQADVDKLTQLAA